MANTYASIERKQNGGGGGGGQDALFRTIKADDLWQEKLFKLAFKSDTIPWVTVGGGEILELEEDCDYYPQFIWVGGGEWLGRG